MTSPPEPASRKMRTSLTEQAAAAFIHRRGCGAIIILGDRAEMAEKRGHPVAAKTWREMADAAARLLRVSGFEVEAPAVGGAARRLSRL